MTLAGGRTFKSLREHRNYRLFFAGQITSVCGTWMQNVALYWLILSITRSPLALGMLSLARFGPFTLFGLFSGVVADRFDNRRTVIVTQSVQMALSALLAAITLLGTVSPWEVYVIAVLTGTAVVFDLPARQNLTVQLVGRDELPNAIALNSSLFNTARIIGPALAGIVIAAVGSGWCFAINSASFLAVLAGLLAMRTSELYKLRDRGRPALFAGAREGLRYVRDSRPVLVLTAIAVVVMSFSLNINVLLPVLAKQTLAAGPRTFGIISACFGAGALAGALVAAGRGRARWRFMLGGIAAFGVAELLIAPLHNVVAVGALLFLCGLCYTTYTSTSNAAVQLETPDHIRGRVLGVYFYAWNGPLPAASPLIGWLCTVGGTELAFAFGGTCALLAAAAGAVAVKRSPPGSLRRPALEPVSA
ncbi:MAG TPA: MFS transporter [Gaiellaceae bacterium]|nr:MFS transporter [Gaiellaceae bacterium]